MRRPAPHPSALLACLLALLLPATIARADDTPAAPPEKAAEGPALTFEMLDLLPLGEFERQDLRAAHLDLSRRLEAIARQRKDLEGRLQKREKKDDEEGRKLAAQIDGLGRAGAVALGELRDVLRPHGLTDALIEQMARAPRGEGRMDRYARSLVLLVPDLTPAQQETFERVLQATEGAWLSGRALAERTELALKQSGLEPRQTREILQSFARQARESDRRFWRLVDYVLTDDQKVALWDMLPTPLRQHDSSEDHVYELPGITPSQGARVKSLVTEIQAESAPDEALVKRVRAEMQKKDLSKEDRAALQKEVNEAYGRLGLLKRRAYEMSLEILGPDLVRAMKAIPPRVSINDRREDGRRVRDGMEITPAQEAQIQALQKEAAVAAKRYQERMQAIRRAAGEVGEDSPETMMMDMMTSEARGAATAVQRELLGRAFLEILTPEQVDGWVLGLYGYRR
jgi:hypothetical protein